MFEKLSKMLKIFKFSASSTLKDGTAIFIDGDLSTGSKVFVETTEGNIPIPDGTYELEDGFMITVESGVITEIEEPKEEETPPGEEEEVIEQETEEEESVEKEEEEEETINDETILEKVEVLTNMVNELLARIESLETLSSDISKENEDLKKQNENFSTQVEEFKTKLGNTPGAEPIKKNVELSTEKKYSNKRLQALKDFK